MAQKKKAKKKVALRKPKKRIKGRLTKKKVIKKKPLVAKKKKAALKPKSPGKPKEKVIGTITHYFPHVQAAVIKLKTALAVGETIKIKGHTTDFTQNISSMQIDRVAVDSAKPGQEIGVLVSSRVRQHDLVYKV